MVFFVVVLVDRVLLVAFLEDPELALLLDVLVFVDLALPVDFFSLVAAESEEDFAVVDAELALPVEFFSFVDADLALPVEFFTFVEAELDFTAGFFDAVDFALVFFAGFFVVFSVNLFSLRVVPFLCCLPSSN